MCTVSYIPATGGYFLTSNRDEKSTRSNALEPKIYSYKNTNLIFPKDPDANGTWIVLKENNDALCLLNGAFTNFIDKGNYQISRGIVVLEIAATQNMFDAFANIDLSKTAPFTLIMIYKNNLYECRWDGEQKHTKQLDVATAYIWSSATLYDEVQRTTRKNWFNKFIHQNYYPTQEEIINFHTYSGDGNVENDLVMNRDNKYFTVSITSIAVTDNSYMLYQNLTTHDRSSTAFAQELATG